MKNCCLILIFIFTIYANTLAQKITGKVISLNGSVILNNKKLSLNQSLNLSPGDSLIAFNGSKVKIQFDPGIILWIKDTARVEISDIYFELKLGLVRMQIPENIPQDNQILIKTGDMMTSVMNDNPYTDYSIYKKIDSTLIGTYQGDSLIIQKIKKGEKSLYNFLNLENLKTIFIQDNQIFNTLPLEQTLIDPSVWDIDISYGEYLFNRLQLDKAQSTFESLARSSDTETKTKIYFYLAYISCFDNKLDQATHYFSKILELDENFMIKNDFNSPKLVNSFQKAYKNFKANKEKQRLSNFKTVSLSAVPGLYHLTNDKKAKGATYMFINLSLWGSFIYFNHQQSKYQTMADEATSHASANSYYDKAVRNYNWKQTAFYSVMALYPVYIFDILQTEKKLKLNISFKKETTYLSFQYNF